MVNAEMKALIVDRFGFMFEEALVDAIAEAGTLQKVAAGDILIDIGHSFEAMPLLIDGTVKILREDESGSELLLYYLERGDTCAMSLSCCMGRTRSKIRAVAEEDSTLVMLPLQAMDDWMSRFQSWKAYVFDSMQVRMNELIEAIDTIAFLRMEERLLKYLRDKAKVLGSMILDTTHQQIATDLHTSRVVISRMLKKLEMRNLIHTGRNQLELLSLS